MARSTMRVYSRSLSAAEVSQLYGLIGYWKLNETSGTTATDSTPFAQNGTVSGTAGWSNRCSGANVFDFNGSNQYISIADASHLRPTAALTIAGWIKGDTWGAGTDFDIILRKGEGNPNNYQLAVADGKLALYLDDSDSNGIRSTTTLNTGQWYHVAATWDGTTAKLYIDGVLDKSAARSGTISTDTRPLYIGGRAGTDLFDGMIYDVRFYNRALNPVEVAALSGQVGLWKFDEGSGTTAADSSPAGNNGTLNGPSWTTGRIAGGLLFDGTSNYVSVPHAANLSLSQEITLAAWVKSTDLTGYRMALSKGTSASDFNCWLGNCGDEITFGFHNGSYQRFDTTNINLSANTWYHLAATFSNAADQVRVYLNGVEVLNATTTATPSVNSESLTLGKDSAGEYWKGILDDVRVYNRVLCPSEIQALYNSGGAAPGVKIVKWIEIQ